MHHFKIFSVFKPLMNIRMGYIRFSCIYKRHLPTGCLSFEVNKRTITWRCSVVVSLACRCFSHSIKYSFFFFLLPLKQICNVNSYSFEMLRCCQHMQRGTFCLLTTKSQPSKLQQRVSQQNSAIMLTEDMITFLIELKVLLLNI